MRRRTFAVAASASLALGGWAVSPLLQVSTAGSAAAAGTTVDCDAGDSLAHAVAGAQTGDVLTVLGTCTESVHVPRTIQQLTIDGGGRATVVGPDAETAPTGPSAFTFFVEGEGVTIQGLEIRGGFHAVHLSGPSSATIVGNTITNSNGAIHLDKGSIGQVAGNTITNNIGYGINVQEDSYARIGFTAPTRGLVPNRITDNDGDGIRIDRWARAWVSGNEVTGNGGSGVVVDRGSHAEVADNLIGANGEDGLAVRRDSGLILTPEGEESATQVAGNRTNAANGGVGLRCDTDSYVGGTVGTLRGREGTYEVDKTCEGELKTPKGTKPLHP